MERKNQLFNMIEPSAGLRNSIMYRIEREEMKKAMYKIVFSSAVSILSAFFAIFSAINIIKDASQSGLSEYLSLMISDGYVVVSYWQTYIMSVAESLPIVPITIIIASVCFFIWSADTFLENLKDTKSIFYKVN